MRIICLGGAGMICREAALDLVQFSEFSTITIADIDVNRGMEVVQWLDDPRVEFIQVDVTDTSSAAEILKDYDIVMDGTPISMNGHSTKCIALAGCHGINLNGFGAEWDYHEIFSGNDRICIPGFGMTPGLTNLMAMHAAGQLDTVESVRCSHGAFRPIAFSKAIAETTRIEYDPAYPARVVFEDGQLKQVPPFARPRQITLPAPYGTHVQYIIPHPEPVTLSKSLAHKGVRLVEARGTWPPENMQLLKTLYNWGMLNNTHVEVDGSKLGILDAVFAYCLQSDKGRNTKLNGYALHVEVTGTKDGLARNHILTHTHPHSDGSVQGWEGLRAYTRNVGIPLSIAVQLICSGSFAGTGVVPPEQAFDPGEVFKELSRRDMHVHEQLQNLSENSELKETEV